MFASSRRVPELVFAMQGGGGEDASQWLLGKRRRGGARKGERARYGADIGRQ